MRIKQAILGISFLFLVSGIDSAYANTERLYAEIKKEFTKALQNRNNATQRLRGYGLPDDKTSLLVNHYMAVMADQSVSDRLFEEFLSFGVIDRVMSNPRSVSREMEATATFAYDLLESLSMKGLRRLDHEDQRQFIRVLNVLIEVLPPKLCRALILGDIQGMQAESALVAYAFSRMSSNEIEMYLRVVRKAVHAETRDFPGVKSVSETQRRSAEKAFELAFLNRMERHPRSIQLLTALDDAGNAPDKDLCDANNQVLLTLLDMTGSLGEWQTRVFVESMQ